MPEERLQKILARAGLASRRKAEELIREGRVTVNGNVAGLGDKADPERDSVKVDGKRVQPQQEKRYLLLNKPRAVMSTISDPEGRPTVMELVPEGMRKALVPVGRLDFLTEGLLLLTDDGDFAQRIAHPSHGCVKTYEVKVSGYPEERDLQSLREGIVLEGERTSPCSIEPRPAHAGRQESENSWWVVQLSQGRTRQIRDMFERIGHPVQKLRRVAIGPLTDSELPLGAVRELTEREVELLKKSAARPPREMSPGRPRRPRRQRGAAGKPAAAEGEAVRPQPPGPAGPPGDTGGRRRKRGGGAGPEPRPGAGRAVPPAHPAARGAGRGRQEELRPELVGLPAEHYEDQWVEPEVEIPAHERKPFGRGPERAVHQFPSAARGARNPTPGGRGTRPGGPRPAHPRGPAGGGYARSGEGGRSAGGPGPRGGGPRQPAPGFRGARHGGPGGGPGGPGGPGGHPRGPRPGGGAGGGGGRRPPRGGGRGGPRRGGSR